MRCASGKGANAASAVGRHVLREVELEFEVLTMMEKMRQEKRQVCRQRVCVLATANAA